MSRPGLRRLNKLLDPYCVTKGGKFRLRDVDPQDTGGDRLGDGAARAALSAHGGLPPTRIVGRATRAAAGM